MKTKNDLPRQAVVCERSAPARRGDGSGEYVRQVDIYCDTAGINSGLIIPDPFFAGSTLVNTETRETWLLTEHADGTKEWSPDPNS